MIPYVQGSTTYSYLSTDPNFSISSSGFDIPVNVNIGTAITSADLDIKGDLKIAGDIIQQGSTYETHAEQLYTTTDEIILRDKATTGLSVGEKAGLLFKKYDGTNDGELKVDKDGIVRVGDVGSTQPLATREESPTNTGWAR